jgi:hypothetical protein
MDLTPILQFFQFATKSVFFIICRCSLCFNVSKVHLINKLQKCAHGSVFLVPYGACPCLSCMLHLSSHILLPSVSECMNYMFCPLITEEQLIELLWNLVWRLCHQRLVWTCAFLFPTIVNTSRMDAQNCQMGRWWCHYLCSSVYLYEVNITDVCLYAFNNCRMAGWIFMKFGMDFVPLETTPNHIKNLHLVISTWQDGLEFVRWDDDAITHDPLCMHMTHTPEDHFLW